MKPQGRDGPGHEEVLEARERLGIFAFYSPKNFIRKFSVFVKKTCQGQVDGAGTGMEDGFIGWLGGPETIARSRLP
jgi:hypothetical protein